MDCIWGGIRFMGGEKSCLPPISEFDTAPGPTIHHWGQLQQWQCLGAALSPEQLPVSSTTTTGPEWLPKDTAESWYMCRLHVCRQLFYLGWNLNSPMHFLKRCPIFVQTWVSPQLFRENCSLLVWLHATDLGTHRWGATVTIGYIDKYPQSSQTTIY